MEIVFDHEMILRNNYGDRSKKLVNTLITIMKQEPPPYLFFITKLSYWYNVDKYIAYKDNKLVQFQNKWKNIY